MTLPPLRRALDCLDEYHFDLARAIATARTPEPRTVAESEVLFEAARLELQARGHPVASQHELLHWLADGVHATRRGERYFDVDADPTTGRLFWSGPTLDPATGDRVPMGNGDLSNMHLAEAIAAERPDTVLLESTTDGHTIERMQLWSEISPDHVRALRSEDPELDAKISAFEAELPGDGYAFQRVVWASMAAQYARDAATAMQANPALETGVVTQQPWPTTDFYAVEYPQMAGCEGQIWYTPQVRTPGPGGLVDPTPGPVNERDLTAAERGMSALPPPAHPYPTMPDPDLARMRAMLAGNAPAFGAVATAPSPGDGSRRREHPPSGPRIEPGLDR
jgi:hypothetical protein